MASLYDQAETIKAAVSSTATCTPATTVILKSILLPKESDSVAEAGSVTTKTGRTTKPKATATSRSQAKKIKPADHDREELPAKEKAVLATHVINVTLKSLGEAARPPPTTPPRQETGREELVKTATRNVLRRSNSSPMTPLQPRSLNRVSTSPVLTTKPKRSPSSSSISNGCLSTVECARVAFSCLRTLQNTGKITLSELQLESGMSSFIGRLIGLGMVEQAIKELRILKRRLDATLGVQAKRIGKPGSQETAPSMTGVAELLDFPATKSSPQAINLVVATQLQILRILSKTKRPSNIDDALPFLRETFPASPLNLLLSSAKMTNGDQAKVARQLENLSQLLLSLTPSVSSSDDAAAQEPRLSISPAVALELQTLGLLSRVHWWRIANHQGNVDKDVLSPLSRCLAAFVRRTQALDVSSYKCCRSAFAAIYAEISSQGQQLSQSSKSPLAAAYQTLATISREVGRLGEAISWAEKLKLLLNPKQDSAAKCCAVAAQLLALQLKRPWQHIRDDALLKQVVGEAQGPLRGDSAELDELLTNLSLVRKASLNILLGQVVDEDNVTYRPQPNIRDLLESFILQLPRFCVRWLGKPPATSGATKDFLRFEQRRQLLLKSVQHILDAALLQNKTRIDEQRISWELMESILHDCLTLLEYIGDVHIADPARSYYVKISHLYFQQHKSLFQACGGDPSDVGPALKALRRAVDCIKYRPSKEKEKGQLISKLERMTDILRASGRKGEVLGTLQQIRTSLVDDGVLGAVAQAMESMPAVTAWTVSDGAESLSRALQAISKIEQTWIDWTVDLEEPERVAALEHRLQFILLGNPKAAHPSLSDPCVHTLLQIYSPQRFPVRRLRTLLRLLSASIDHTEEFSAVRSEMDETLGALDTGDAGEDKHLAKYVPHLKALISTLIGLSEGGLEDAATAKALRAWDSMLEACQTSQDFEQRIDDVSGFLEHLRSMADMARLKGHDDLLLTVLRLSSRLSSIASVLTPAERVSDSAAFALQLVNLGQSSSAVKVLEQARGLVQQSDNLVHEIQICFHLSYAEYSLATGNPQEASGHLVQAKEAMGAGPAGSIPRSRLRWILSQASLLYSLVALARGESHRALLYARNSARVLFQEWSRLEEQASAASFSLSTASSGTPAGSDDTSITEQPSSSESPETKVFAGPEAWRLAYPLIRSLLELSRVYGYLGMYQETMYYAEQAQKVARGVGSEVYMAQCAAWAGYVNVKAGKTEKLEEFVDEARSNIRLENASCTSLALIRQLGNIYHELGDIDAEADLLETAEAMINKMVTRDNAPGDVDRAAAVSRLESEMGKLTIKENPARTVRRTRTQTTQKAPRKAAVPKAKAPAKMKDVVPEDACVVALRSSLSVQKAAMMVYARDWSNAIKILREPKPQSNLLHIDAQSLVTIARAFLGQSLEQMGKDAVFSVVQDSTLSFPSVCNGASDKGSDRHSLTKVTPPRKGRAAAATQDRDSSKGRSQDFFDSLKEAREYLLEAHSIAATTADGGLVHHVSGLLQTVAILLSAASAARKGVLGHPGYATCTMEMARNVTWRRERKALLLEKSSATSVAGWPEELISPGPKRASLGLTVDMNQLQRDYIDIIPQPWSVISVSLSENKHDLCISKLQAGQSPFVIRLPLERASSRDADSEVFNFQQGRSEMLELIKLANDTCHDKRDFSMKGAKTAWWAEREALDVRLKGLLENIEDVWLGGFKGIFSQHQRRQDLLARFQKSFQNVLDKHLPSRRQVRGRRAKAATPKVNLDPRILELFIGLGDASDPECDFDEALNDLLYFVVDILQFNGERNAYDEIDFDSMVVDTFDALHAYHSTAKERPEREDGVHTILILDKALHVFPWESLPCMQEAAVSRMPSLACLRRLIMEQQPRKSGEKDVALTQGSASGHWISPGCGSYILNPGSDLKSTQETFEKPLSSSLPPSWKRIVSRAPTEGEFETALSDADVLLYFGHGSGGQYIKGRTIRKLDKCRAAVLLMGCSSASLADVGDFECHGPVWNYMLAGCPAAVGTLWDVTDRDIDRLAGRVLEEWGLVGKGTFVEDGNSAKWKKSSSSGRGGAKKAARRADADCEAGSASLVQAVVRARDACRFRYLTAAAVCVYGIPVYVGK
ncbi:Separin [Pleurostoma richardsiae]|uniref:separase n=1 Tax=Pleurostoma richardsiae TaxID=41990 RepID=A0AA38VV99_9PEZI|nr:Separin [Pleurostoma richardsiae]